MASGSEVSPSGDTMGWVKSLGSSGLKKVAYMVMEWVMSKVGMGGDGVPGAKNGGLNAGALLNLLKDGQILGKLANVLSPGAVDTSADDPKSKAGQLGVIGKFLDFAKDKAGVDPSMLFNGGDLQAGKKSAMPGLLSTLVNIGGNSESKFGIPGLDMGSIAQVAAEEAGKNAAKNFFSNLFKK